MCVVTKRNDCQECSFTIVDKWPSSEVSEGCGLLADDRLRATTARAALRKHHKGGNGRFSSVKREVFPVDETDEDVGVVVRW